MWKVQCITWQRLGILHEERTRHSMFTWLSCQTLKTMCFFSPASALVCVHCQLASSASLCNPFWRESTFLSPIVNMAPGFVLIHHCDMWGCGNLITLLTYYLQYLFPCLPISYELIMHWSPACMNFHKFPNNCLYLPHLQIYAGEVLPFCKLIPVSVYATASICFWHCLQTQNVNSPHL